MKDRVRVLTGINFRNVGPGWAEKAIAQLEADVAAGAVGIGEIGKGFGLSTQEAGRDAPAASTIPSSIRSGQACARLKLPVFIHTADPQEFFKPIDLTNERWLELALFPGRRYPRRAVPELRAADDGARQPVPAQSEDDVRHRAHGLARERPRRGSAR